MAATKISDLAIVPETFQAYVEKLIMEKSALFQSGIMVSTPTLIPANGKITNAPAYLGFTGADEVLSDSGSLTVNSVGSTNAISVINFRGKAYGANDLVTQLSGKDPLGNLASKFADYWVRRLNAVTLSTIKGSVLGMEVDFAGVIVNDISLAAAAASNITAGAALDTVQLMGEYQEDLGIMICHSAVANYLRKNDIDNSRMADSDSTALVSYLGRRVVIDDTIAPENDGGSPSVLDVYSTYFVAAGAMSYAEGLDPSLSIETDRDILAGDDIVTSRKRFIAHPNGASFVGTPSGVGPTNTELATVGSWDAEDATEDKKFMIRVLKHKIDQS